MSSTQLNDGEQKGNIQKLHRFWLEHPYPFNKCIRL